MAALLTGQDARCAPARRWHSCRQGRHARARTPGPGRRGPRWHRGPRRTVHRLSPGHLGRAHRHADQRPKLPRHRPRPRLHLPRSRPAHPACPPRRTRAGTDVLQRPMRDINARTDIGAHSLEHPRTARTTDRAHCAACTTPARKEIERTTHRPSTIPFRDSFDETCATVPTIAHLLRRQVWRDCFVRQSRARKQVCATRRRFGQPGGGPC